MEVNDLIRWGVFVALIGGCASAVTSYSGANTGSASAGAGAGSSSGGGPDASFTPATVGQACSPTAAVDLCASSGLVCDATSATCRLPSLGEQCLEDAGCASAIAHLGCYPASLSGIPESVCLVPCTSTDSSVCPYGTSCGDPNLAGFCSADGSGCTPWGTCALGGGVSGSCAPSGGTHAICFASGTETAPYAACDPLATNGAASTLCAAGSVCLALPLTLGGTAEAGFCFPLCGVGGPSCAAGTHCDQASADVYGICKPGAACQLSSEDTCPIDLYSCVPDSASTLTGGCLPVASDAGGFGRSCAAPAGVALTANCESGEACLPVDGGYACTPLCSLADGGEPYCQHAQLCTARSLSGLSDAVGACR